MSRIITLLAALVLAACAVPTAAQTPAPAPRAAPVGHQQPRASDLPLDVSRQEGEIGPEAKEIDKKLDICRGC